MNNYPNNCLLESFNCDYFIAKIGSIEIDRFVEVRKTPNGPVDVITYKLPKSGEIIAEIICPRSELM
ncbi:hypothetical protein c7_R1144 [Megavirus courdo7]|uniref:Uncharacterized protein n=1 Tax=Megavirus courdo7 TaxID=1128135 RepID=H2EC68_9VIRU|nr:hypothetical protein c7_R1144 [Megavirus courdo7]